MESNELQSNKSFVLFIVLLIPVFIWSFSAPHNMTAWIGEVLPVLIGVLVLLKTNKTFPLSKFSYVFIFIGFCLMLIGAHFSYGKEPIFEWLKVEFDLSRNNFDKLGHFFQGIIPVLIIREIFLRKNVVNYKNWVEPLAIILAIAISAIWELLEWGAFFVYKFLGFIGSAEVFLGMQNYVWDAQSDIFMAVLGAMSASLILRRYHETSIKALSHKKVLP